MIRHDIERIVESISTDNEVRSRLMEAIACLDRFGYIIVKEKDNHAIGNDAFAYRAMLTIGLTSRDSAIELLDAAIERKKNQ